ncbi:DUF1285 domain-containing protein [Anaeromyxobacter oryzae]|uniref:DUF1285 domain-containing protein n=1 Tax=Anaeromyxobacter oryzae TaxID=2918170 RepID=A0ABM7WSX8_9BACT|nr:DUF1285 domain-containing protein [Anaeromyxobacter oryzae]BDG02525.1 hypothetical protein AMOR_15210 [Anaeromyxobacter oryzae]
MADPDDDALELLRTRSGLSIDAEGRFLHRGEPITHRRTLEVLHRSLRLREDGRYEVAIGRERGYVEVVDAPYTVRGVELDPPGGAPTLRLSDGSAEPLDPATLVLGADGALRCRVKGGYRARFTRAGQVTLGLALEEDPPGSGHFILCVNGDRFHIPRE